MCKITYYLAACGHGIIYDEEDCEYCVHRPMSPYGPVGDTCFDHPHYKQTCLGPDPDDEVRWERMECEDLELELDKL